MRVFDFVWVDDFAAVRNAALALAMGNYAFWLDADDVVDRSERVPLEQVIANLRSGEETAYVVKYARDRGRNAVVRRGRSGNLARSRGVAERSEHVAN